MNRYLLSPLLLVSLTSSNRHVAPAEAAAPAVAVDPMEIKAGPNILPRITVGEVTSAEVGASITVAARVAVDDTRVTRVGSPVMGRIASLSVREGEDVRRGQLLAML